MGSPFTRTKATLSEPNRDYGLFSFAFSEMTPIPIQVLEIPADVFDRFPTVKRHWPRRDGKTIRPLICTSGAEHTGSKCLSCYARQNNLVSFGQYDPSEDVVIPVFDHGNYRKVDKKFQVVPLHIPIYDNDKTIRKGGTKVMYANSTTFNKLLTEHDNVQNHCAKCNSHMALESMNCESCDDVVHDQARVNSMTKDEFLTARYSEVSCVVCNHKGVLDIKRICMACKNTTPKRIYDVITMATLTKVPRPNKPGEFKSEYGFSLSIDPRYVALQLPKDILDAFWTKFKTEMQGPTLLEQSTTLQMNIPEEWLKALNTQTQKARPYGV